MSLPDIVARISRSVVALGLRIEQTASNQPPSFPVILGTGFVVDSRGLVVTNRHVTKALQSRPTRDTFVAFFHHSRDANDRVGVGAIFRSVNMWFGIEEFEAAGRYFGDSTPDMEFIGIDVKNLDALEINSDPFILRAGADVVSVGFPSGRDRLSPHGGNHPSQFHPFARKGIISSVLPCPCANPHGFSIDVLHEGGSSGSPICDAVDGRVLGLLYAGFDGEPITYGVPGWIMAKGLASVKEQWNPDESVPSFEDLAAQISSGGERPFSWNRLGPE